jgi:hypothetical protein
VSLGVFSSVARVHVHEIPEVPSVAMVRGFGLIEMV